MLPPATGSIGLLTTYSLSPLGEGVGSNHGSNGERNESQIEHDRVREAEIDKALAAGDVEAARKAANVIRGRKAQLAAYEKIDVYKGAHNSGEVPT